MYYLYKSEKEINKSFKIEGDSWTDWTPEEYADGLK